MRKKKKNITAAIGDLTLNDSANAPKPVSRASKKPITGPEISDADFSLMEPPDTGERDAVALLNHLLSPPPSVNESTYRVILPEIWMLISSHIRPEDVASFAAICRTTCDITRRAPFWHHMYRRYGPKVSAYGMLDVDLPMRLRPESMVRLGGLRACVVRTLFYTHSPFVHRLEQMNRNLDLTSFTSGRRLKILQMWSVQLTAKLWAYYFRLQSPIPHAGDPVRCPDPLRNVLDNPDEGCRILYVESTKFVPLPQNFDQPQHTYLQAVTYNMSHGLRSYKVNLEMVRYNGAPFTKFVLDPATNIKVWDWWHPAYHQVRKCGQDVALVDDDEDSYFNL